MFYEFLFRKSKLCIPKCSVRDFLRKEADGGGLMGHFGINKTYNICINTSFGQIWSMIFISFVANVLNAKNQNLDHNQMNCILL